MTRAPAIKDKLDALPSSPGVYVFKGTEGEYLYVGKAANLKSRVRSYFNPNTNDSRFFIDRLVYELGDIETYVVQSEKEAALLENSLIKERRPRYNVKLRDDKEFLSLRLDPSAAWPRLEVVRRPKKDGARYFGPYHSASDARSMLRLCNRYFQLRTCTDSELASRTRPCLQYQIKRCPGPCVFDVEKAQYARQTQSVGLFLEGRHDELRQDLGQAMNEAAAAERYELAAVYRNQLRAVESTQQHQRVSLVSDVDQDVFGYFRQDDKAELAVLLVRRGKVVSVRTFDLRGVRLPDEELVASFVGEYYRRGSYVPHEVVIPSRIEAESGLAEVLGEQRGSRVRLTRPQRGQKARLLRMAMENAAHAYREKARAREDMDARLAQMKQRLSLPRMPHRIECIDVSHLGGSETVAVVVSFHDGEPDRKHYRSFHVRNVRPGDDYGAMHEVLLRRFRRARAEREAGAKGDASRWGLPDLLVVDGGKGQLKVAQAALEEIGLPELPLAALAKEKENVRGEKLVDRVYLPGRMNAVELRDGGHALRLLAQARDEAHRASNALRVKLTKRNKVKSGLDRIAGIGPKSRRVLLTHFGSLAAVESASREELQESGVTARQAETIYQHFHGADASEQAETEDAAVDNAFR